MSYEVTGSSNNYYDVYVDWDFIKKIETIKMLIQDDPHEYCMFDLWHYALENPPNHKTTRLNFKNSST